MSTQRTRLDRIADRLTPSPTLRRIAERAAAEHGLDPRVVIAEAERILAEAAASERTVEELIAEEHGVDAAAVRERARAILAGWAKEDGR